MVEKHQTLKVRRSRDVWIAVVVCALVVCALVVASVGWAVYWFATADERMEREAVGELVRWMPYHLLRVRDYSYSDVPKVCALDNGTWAGDVAEWVPQPSEDWDYRRTGSKAFPFEARVAIRYRRWITKPYATEAEAPKAISPPAIPRRQSYRSPAEVQADTFFEVEADGLFPDNPPKRQKRPDPAILAASLTYDAARKSWVSKSIEEFRETVARKLGPILAILPKTARFVAKWAAEVVPVM